MPDCAPIDHDPEPLWDEAGFTAFLEGLATDDAPRLFAVAVEHGHRHDGHIAAYGMAFHDHAEIVSTAGDFRAHLQTPENALAYFQDDEDDTPRLVWLSSTWLSRSPSPGA
ncbi:hypothetical protein [Saccharothrix obliqua]|uniref:hypothetical protein n=1 Tax=Saccharothrix obliqua TaxID=2861747 RepID=UPI001C5E8D27|nr:hypothetical protein [Saccharothrix obliqua]MBW4719605.1 hypothetical protein [Saccharothrix obliqua]